MKKKKKATMFSKIENLGSTYSNKTGFSFLTMTTSTMTKILRRRRRRMTSMAMIIAATTPIVIRALQSLS